MRHAARLLVLGLSLSTLAHAAPFTFEAEHYKASLESRTTEAWDNVRVNYQGQLLKADRVTIDKSTGDLKAWGHISVEKGELLIRAERAELNLESGFGTFYDSTLRSGKMFFLEGRSISYYEKDRYRVLQGKVSRCQDCPQSWSVTGAYMDVELEGFAEVHHALIQVKDTPILYLPFYVLPVKTKRQSGLLFPSYSYTREMKNRFGQAYYWAISKSADTTVDYLYSTQNNHRLADEFRYRYSDRSFLDANQSLMAGPSSAPEGQKGVQYGVSLFERWQITPNLSQRLRSEIQSHPRYALLFKGDFPSYLLPDFVTEPSLTWQNQDFVAYGLVRLHQDALFRNQCVIHYRPGDPSCIGSDRVPIDPSASTPSQGALNNLPELGASVPSFRLLGPVRSSTDLQFINFRRSGPSFDPLTTWGTYAQGPLTGQPQRTRWLREGSRFTATTRLTAVENFSSVFQWRPTLELRADAYRFDAPGVPSSAMRARYLLDQTFGTSISRVWKTETEDLRALKHVIEPYIRWSYSDTDWTTKHMFFDQGNEWYGLPGAPQFDIFDPNGERSKSAFGTATEEQRLRENHLVTFALATRLMGRFGESSRRIDTLVEGRVLQDLDLYHRDEHGTPTWGPFHVLLGAGYAGLRVASELAYNWQTGNSDFMNDASYSWASGRYGVGMFQKFDSSGSRFYGGGGEVNNIGAWSAAARVAYNQTLNLNEQTYRVVYSGSDSHCFFFNLGVAKPYDQRDYSFQPEVGFMISESGQRTSVNSMLNGSRTAR